MTKPFEDASVWTARDFPMARSWVRRLEPRHLEEIDAALAQVRRTDAPFWALGPADFPLRETAELLRATAEELERGRGFAVIGGFPVERYDYDDNLLAYAGLVVSNAPYLIPPSVTLWQAAAHPSSQVFFLIGAAILMPMILGYTVFVFWLFRGKLQPGEGYH